MNTPPMGFGSPAVLVVDDVRDAADSTALLLTLHGFRLRACYDGVSALQAAATDPPDVVLTDVVMPGMDGWTLIRRLREQTVGTPPFVIVVSGLCKTEDQQKSAEAGADLHLVKPVVPAELISILSRLQKSE